MKYLIADGLFLLTGGIYKVPVCLSSDRCKFNCLIELVDEIVWIGRFNEVLCLFGDLNMTLHAIRFHLVCNHNIRTINVVSHDFCTQNTSYYRPLLIKIYKIQCAHQCAYPNLKN